MNLQVMLSVFSQVRQFRQRDHWTHQQVKAYQASALRKLRDYAYEHSPFYQHFHQGLYDAPLQELPVLTKALLMEHFDELVTDRAIGLEEVKAQMKALISDELILGRYRVVATRHFPLQSCRVGHGAGLLCPRPRMGWCQARPEAPR